MYSYIIVLLFISTLRISLIAATVLTCHQPNPCSGRVSCQCREANGLLVWIVSSPAAGGTELCRERYQPSSGVMEGEVSSPCPGYTARLDSSVEQDGDLIFTSTLNFTLTGNLMVNCTDITSSTQNITLQLANEYIYIITVSITVCVIHHAGSPSPPVNLKST